MIFTDLSYIDVGGIIATLLIIMFSVVMVIRLIMAFRHYIYNGDCGDGEKSAFVSLMEGNWSDLVLYSFTGYHPGMVLVDAMMLGLFSLLVVGLWAPLIIMGLFILLGHVMRKRIAVKQTFVGNLKGDQLDEETE